MAAMPRLMLLAVLAAAAFATATAQAGTAAEPFVWARPARLVGTPYASEIEPLGNGKYGYKPITIDHPFYVRYNKTPHNLFLSAKKSGRELGEVAPEEFVDGKVYTVNFPSPGTYYINDVYKNYDETENAFLKVTYT